MSDFTYDSPSDDDFFYTLEEWLKASNPALVQLLANTQCHLELSSTYSKRRWNAYKAWVHVKVPISSMGLFTDEVRELIREAADQVLPVQCGYDIVDVTISPALTGRPKNHDLAPLHEAAELMTIPNLIEQIDRMRGSSKDTRLLIGTAKELVETTCKTILRERGHTEDLTSLDLPQLSKRALAAVTVVPEHASSDSESTVRRLAGGLGNVVHALAELRNLHGSGHGPDGVQKGLESRHARLAVGMAATLATFLIESHQAQ